MIKDKPFPATIMPDKDWWHALWPDPEAALLKKGGRFAIINWYRRPREETTVLDQPRVPETDLRMEPEDVRAVVEPAGFVFERIVDVGPYHYG